jgi:hypothetical protein
MSVVIVICKMLFRSAPPFAAAGSDDNGDVFFGQLSGEFHANSPVGTADQGHWLGIHFHFILSSS